MGVAPAQTIDFDEFETKNGSAEIGEDFYGDSEYDIDELDKGGFEGSGDVTDGKPVRRRAFLIDELPCHITRLNKESERPNSACAWPNVNSARLLFPPTPVSSIKISLSERRLPPPNKWQE